MFIIIITVFFANVKLEAVASFSHVRVFLFILVAFCDEKNNLLYSNVIFSA